MVTFPPTKPLATKSAAKDEKSSGLISIASYDPSIPYSLSQKPWISGERECLIGKPVTKALVLAIDKIFLPQFSQKRQQGQTDNGKIIAFDFFKQLNTRALDLICADA